MSQVIVFDLYGVIARPQSEAARRRIEDLAGVAEGPGVAEGSARPGISAASFWEAYWACRPAYDAGQESTAYWAAVAARLGVGGGFADVSALIEADLDSWCEADDEMVALVTALAEQGRTLGLLSNTISDLVPRFEARHRTWLSRFDALTYSCDIGVAKPDPQAYRVCCERLGVTPPEALFFDDRDENVLAAREVGMRAEVFTSPAQIRTLLTAV